MLIEVTEEEVENSVKHIPSLATVVSLGTCFVSAKPVTLLNVTVVPRSNLFLLLVSFSQISHMGTVYFQLSMKMSHNQMNALSGAD